MNFTNSPLMKWIKVKKIHKSYISFHKSLFFNTFLLRMEQWMSQKGNKMEKCRWRVCTNV